MNHDRIKTLIDCYGADTENWPRDEMEAAIQLLDASPELIAYQDNARALDNLLVNHEVADEIDTSVLANRILDNLPEQPKQTKTPYIMFATAAAVTLVFVTTWLLQPTTSDIPFSEPTEIAQFEQWAWEEALNQTPLAVLDNDEPVDELSIMEI